MSQSANGSHLSPTRPPPFAFTSLDPLPASALLPGMAEPPSLLSSSTVHRLRTADRRAALNASTNQGTFFNLSPQSISPTSPTSMSAAIHDNMDTSAPQPPPGFFGHHTIPGSRSINIPIALPIPLALPIQSSLPRIPGSILATSSINTTPPQPTTTNHAQGNATSLATAINISPQNSTHQNGQNATDIVAPELQPLSNWFGQTYPFLVLLFLMFIYQHFRGLTTFLAFFYVFSRIDDVVKYEVSLKADRSIFHCYILLMILTSTFIWIQVFCKGPTSFFVIFLGFPEKISFLSCLWVVVMNDMIMTNICLSTKVLYIMAFLPHVPSRRNGNNFAIMESFFKLIRFCLPIPIWGLYFTSSINGDFVPSLIAILYPLFKTGDLSNKIAAFRNVVSTSQNSDPIYGRVTSVDSLDESEKSCPICQESEMISPLALSCGHVFCDDCITRWFENNSTCPICRAVIRTSQFKMHTDGSTSIMVQLF